MPILIDWINRLISLWFIWQNKRWVKDNPDLVSIDEIYFTQTASGIDLRARTMVAAEIAQNMAELLEGRNATNYVEMDVLARQTQMGRPRRIRLTVQWADGESPAVKASRLQAELDGLKQKLGATI